MEYVITETSKTRIGYDPTKPLGTPGAVGTVYETDHPGWLAKVCRVPLTDDVVMSLRFHAADKDVLKAAGVVPFCGLALPNVILMERAPGQSLESIIAEWVSDPNDSPSFLTVIEVALALARSVAKLEASARQWSHLDIKPDNAFVAFNKKGGVSQFTLIDLDSVLPGSVRIGTHTVSPEPIACGTTGYLRPEMLVRDTERMDHEDQLYAMAVTLFRILYGGRFPTDGIGGQFIGVDYNQLTLRKKFPRYTDLAHAPPYWSLAKAIPPALDELLRRTLVNGPGERPRPIEFVAVLNDLHQQLRPQQVVIVKEVNVTRQQIVSLVRAMLAPIHATFSIPASVVFVMATLGYVLSTMDRPTPTIPSTPPSEIMIPDSPPAKHRLRDISKRYQ